MARAWHGKALAYISTSSPPVTVANAANTGNAPFATVATSGSASDLSGTLPPATLPNPSASTLGGVESYAPVSHQWINTISTSGVPSSTQPAFSDISGAVAAAQLPNPSASTLGGVQSITAVSHQFLTSISTSGVPAQAQPAAADISGLGSLATLSSVNNSNWSGTALAVANGGTGSTTAQAATQALGTWFTVAKSAATGMSHTGDTNETALATITIPANTLGANGVLRITTSWTMTNNGNTKTLNVRLGGTGLSGTLYLNTAQTSIATASIQTVLYNQNSTGAQVGQMAVGNALGYGTATGALPTSAVDMTTSQQLVISGKLGVNTDTVTLSSYLVEAVN